MIVSRPSRLTSPMRAQTLLVPTSIPTRTASRSTVSFVSVRVWVDRRSVDLQEMTPDEGHVIEDPQAEGEECHEVQVQPEPIADEGQQDRDDRIDQEPADEDAIVVHAVEFGANGSEDGVEGREDRHRGVSAELEADIDIEDESCKDAHEEPEQG
jgi:hypothetical protein